MSVDETEISIGKPDSIGKREWQAFCSLEGIAKQRDYRPIGLLLARNVVAVTLSLSEKTAGTILRRLAKPPFEWIAARGGQVYIRPMGEICKIGGEGWT